MSLVTGSGGGVALGPRLAAGGQGEVFAVTSPRGLVFKRYLQRTLDGDPALERRLAVMVARRPGLWREPGSGHLSLAWPSDMVREDGRFSGFLMPGVDIAATVGMHRVTNPTDRGAAAGATSWARGFTWRYLVRTAANLARATQALHAAGVVIGDFNESNVRVWRDARVTLLDCDSMQMRDPESGEWFFCRVGRPEFTPPELAGADWSVTVRHPSSDLFALAVHVYQLLLEGEHPFRGLWRGTGEKPSVPELAAQGTWALRPGSLLRPRPAAIGEALLPPDVRELFRLAFEDGAMNPVARPSAAQWRGTLEELDGHLQQCAVNQAHVYPGGQQACPWCEHSSRVAAAMLVHIRRRPTGADASGTAAPRTGTSATGTPGTGSSAGTRSGTRVPGTPSLRRRRRRRGIIAGGVAILALAGVLTGLALRSSGPPFALADPGGQDFSAVAYSPSGGTLATGDSDGSIYLWSPGSGKVVATLTDPDSQGVEAVAFSPGGTVLAAGDMDGSTYLWNPATGRRIATLTDAFQSAGAVAFSPSGKMLATSGVDADLWNVRSGKLITSFSDADSSAVVAVAFSPDGSMVAGGDQGGSTELWSVGTGQILTTVTDPHSQGVEATAFSPAGTELAVADSDGSTYVWSVTTGQLMATLTDPGQGSHDADAVAFSPDGKLLAVGDHVGGTYLWNVASGKLAATITDPGYGPRNPNQDWVDAVAFSPSGSTLAVADVGSDETYLWNLSQVHLK